MSALPAGCLWHTLDIQVFLLTLEVYCSHWRQWSCSRIRVEIHFGVTPLFSIRVAMLESLHNCCNDDAGTQCEWALRDSPHSSGRVGTSGCWGGGARRRIYLEWWILEVPAAHPSDPVLWIFWDTICQSIELPSLPPPEGRYWQIQRGDVRNEHPPSWSNFFHFHVYFGKMG